MSNQPTKTNGVISELQERLREEEVRKARRLLVLAGKMTNYEALVTIKDILEKRGKNGKA